MTNTHYDTIIGARTLPCPLGIPLLKEREMRRVK